jgi:hypothetical protein
MDAFYSCIWRLGMVCPEYSKVWVLAPGEMVRLDGARGTTLRVTRGVLWVTQEGDVCDLMLNAGDAFTIERGGLTLVESLGAATVCVLARHIDEVRAGVRRPTLAARASAWLRSVGAAAARRWVPYF